MFGQASFFEEGSCPTPVSAMTPMADGCMITGTNGFCSVSSFVDVA